MPFALLPLLLNLAPTVASWVLGDKTGTAVEKVTGIAREVLGTDDAGSIERAIATDPNIALQFRQALIQAEASARQAELDTLRAQLADVASARSQTIELAKAGSAISWGAPVVSVIVTAGFFVMLYMVIRQEIPEGSQRLADIMMGWLGAAFSAVVGYWVGSSAGSASKDGILSQIARR